MGGYPVKYESQGDILRGLSDFTAWAIERRGLWPGIMTLCLFAVFGPPLIAAWRVSTDPSAKYWIGGWPFWICVVVVALIVVCHFWQLLAGRPRFFPILLSGAIPALVIMVAGYFVMVPIGGVVQELASTDCVTYDRKVEVENAYRSALELFDSCVTRVAQATESTVQVTAPLIDLTDCAEYKSSKDFQLYGREWAYLQALEDTQFCSGWCTPGSPALWSRNHDVMDLCSNTASIVLQGKVKRLAVRMVALGAAALVVSIYAIFSLQEFMTKQGINW